MDKTQYTLERVGNMLKWLVSSGVIAFFLTQLSEYVGGLKLSPEIAMALLMFINTALFAVRSYIEGGKQ